MATNFRMRFGHPRFGTFYYDTRLDHASVKPWSRDSSLGDTRRSGGSHMMSCRPRGVPLYLIRHYGAHLERSGSEETPALLTAGWRDAWYVHEGEAYIGFRTDVERTLKIAQQVNQRSAEKRCDRSPSRR